MFYAGNSAREGVGDCEEILMLRKKYDREYFTSPLYHVFSEEPKIGLLERNLVGTSVLDVGCGCGDMLASLPDKYDRMGVDVSEEGIALAREGHPGIDFRVMDIEKETIDRRFDTVLALDVLEHLADPEKAIEKVTGAAKERGRLIVSVPNNHGPAGMLAVPVMNRLDATHINTLKRERWKALLRKHGWNTVAEYNKLGSRFYASRFSSWIGTSVILVAERDADTRVI